MAFEPTPENEDLRLAIAVVYAPKYNLLYDDNKIDKILADLEVDKQWVRDNLANDMQDAYMYVLGNITGHMVKAKARHERSIRVEALAKTLPKPPGCGKLKRYFWWS